MLERCFVDLSNGTNSHWLVREFFKDLMHGSLEDTFENALGVAEGMRLALE